jgi:hypothetical protein
MPNRIGAIFLATAVRTIKNPDRYAAAICIRVRPDRCCPDISSEKAVGCPYREGVTDFRRYPMHEVWNALLLFLLG